MNILQISTVWVPTTPNMKYGGTERVVNYLDRQFVNMGHRSYVAAPGDSIVKGILLETLPQSIWSLSSDNKNRQITRSNDHYKHHYEIVVSELLKGEIDVAHDHAGNSIFMSDAYPEKGQHIKQPILTTLHGSLNLDRHKDKYDLWNNLKSNGRKIFFNAISYSQKKEFEGAVDICDVIYPGLPLANFLFQLKKSDYLFSLGRISPEKGQHIAIEVAKKAGEKLVIGGEVHSVCTQYFEEQIKPHIDGDQIKFIGSLDEVQKAEWYRNAKAFLMPIQWNEPFGLVMIEAMATGTPVVAFNRASVPEVIEDGKTGFIVENVEEMVSAVKRIDSINPFDCRKTVESRFTIEKEAQAYLDLYEKLIHS